MSVGGLSQVFARRGSDESGDQWIAVSDLMAGLMVIFLFVAITHIRYIEQATPFSPKGAGGATATQSSNELSAEDALIASWLKTIDSRNWQVLVDTVRERAERRAEARARLEAESRLSEEQRRLKEAGERLPTPAEAAAARAEAAKLRRESTRETRAAGQAIRSLLDPSQAENIEIYTALATVLQLEQKRLVEDVRAERDLVGELQRQFGSRLAAWNAEIDAESLVIRFNSPETLFQARSSELTDRFRLILRDFIPRYLAVLSRFESHIDEVRIEGHSSSEWADAISVNDAFFRNLELSQGRARATAEYALSLPLTAATRDWARRTLTTVGMSSSRPIVVDGVEDRALSRRVEFRIQTTAREKAENVLETLDDAIKTRQFLDPKQ